MFQKSQHGKDQKEKNSLLTFFVWSDYTSTAHTDTLNILFHWVICLCTQMTHTAHAQAWLSLIHLPSGNPHLVAKLKVKVTGVRVKAKVNALTVVPDDILCSRVLVGTMTNQLLKPECMHTCITSCWLSHKMLTIPVGAYPMTELKGWSRGSKAKHSESWSSSSIAGCLYTALWPVKKKTTQLRKFMKRFKLELKTCTIADLNQACVHTWMLAHSHTHTMHTNTHTHTHTHTQTKYMHAHTFACRSEANWLMLTHLLILKGVTISGKVRLCAMERGTPTWSMDRLGSGVITEREEKSTRFPIRLPRTRPSLPLRRAARDFRGRPDFCTACTDNTDITANHALQFLNQSFHFISYSHNSRNRKTYVLSQHASFISCLSVSICLKQQASL